MKTFEHPYYKINKIYLTLFGLWPSTNSNIRLILRFFTINSMCLCIVLPQAINFLKYLSDVYILLEFMPLLSGSIICLTKAWFLMVNFDKVKELIEHIEADRNDLIIESEIFIINKHAKKGKQLTVLYSAAAFVPMALVLLAALSNPFLDIILPLNESRSRILIFAAEFFINEEKHYYIILFLESIGFLVSLVVTITADSFYMVLVQHSAGMFSLLCYRLENLGTIDTETNNMISYNNNEYFHPKDLTYYKILLCIKLHLRNMQFVELLKSTFTMCFIFDIGMGAVLQSMSAVMFTINRGHTFMQLKHGLLSLTQCMRIFITSYPGQLLIDYSSSISAAIYNSKWYNISLKSKKLLIFLMMRSNSPCKLTIAKLYVMNIENSTKILRACVSYCMVVLSVQDSRIEN